MHYTVFADSAVSSFPMESDDHLLDSDSEDKMETGGACASTSANGEMKELMATMISHTGTLTKTVND